MATGNLPAQLTPFIGRTDEIAAIVDRLDNPHCRLLTLVGPGGIGKTRLAIEVASRQFHSFADGVYFVGLQPITSIDHVVPTVASAVGFEFYDGHNPTAQLLRYLHEQCLLLILDNFEHLLPASDVVTELLTGVPQLKLLVTSREALNLRQEWLFHVEGMPYPHGKPIGAIDAYSAVRLFVERAQRVRHDFSLSGEVANVVRVCQLVEGMPLGIELAATWLRRLPCSEIAAEIQRGLDFLETDMDGVPHRHHSIRAVFDHSWKLLNEEERSALMGLSVFRGGFRREAAEQVAGATLHTLSALVDKSLLWVNPSGRYELHELQRQYAEERLDEIPEEKTTFRDRHSAYFADLVSRRALDFLAQDFMATLHAIDADIDNIRAAWNWAVEHKRVSDLSKAMNGVWLYAFFRGRYLDAEQAFHVAVASLREIKPTTESEIALAAALTIQGMMDIWLGRRQRARKQHLQESVAILRRLDARPELMRAVGGLGWTLLSESRWEIARSLLEEAVLLAKEVGDDQYRAFVFELLGLLAYERGQREESEDWHQQALVLAREIGDQRTVASSLDALGNLALASGQYVKAGQLFEQSLEIARAHELLVFVIDALNYLSQVAMATGEFATAEGYLGENLAIALQYGRPASIAWTIIKLADVLRAQGRYTEAQEHYHQAQVIAVDIANRQLIADVQAGMGKVALCTGNYSDAWQHYSESLKGYRETRNRPLVVTTLSGNRPPVTDVLTDLGTVALMQGNLTRSRLYFLEALQEGIALDMVPSILHAVAGVMELFIRQGNLAQAVRLAALVAKHPASRAESKDRAGLMLTRSEAEWPIVGLGTAMRQGANTDLSTMAAQLVEQLAAPIHQPLVEPLSERELEVLRLVAAGKSNREIARDLTLALGTVKAHLHTIMQKLEASNRTEAVTRARDLRLL